MPQVPRYGERQVGTAPLPTVRWDTNIPREAVAAVPHVEIGGLERSLTDVYEREKQKADQIAVTGAEARAAALETDISDEVSKMQGANALLARDHLKDRWQKGVGDIAKDLHNDTQRMAFQRSSVLRYEGLYRSTSQHIRTQVEAHDDDQTQKFVDNETKAMVAAAVKGVGLKDLGDRVTDGVVQVKAHLLDFAKRKGMSPEATQNLVDQQLSHLHTLLIERMLGNDDDVTAKKWLGIFKDEIKGQDLINSEKAVDVGSTRGESQRRANDIYSRHPNDPEGAIAEVKKIDDPKLQDATRERVEHEYDKDKALRRDKEDGLYMQATQKIESMVRSGRPFLAADVVGSGIWSQLPLQMRTALERRALHADADYPNDPYKWHEFLYMDPKDMGKLNQSEFESRYWAHFDRETRFRAELMWKNAVDATKGGKHDAKMAADMTFTQITKDALQKLDPVYRTKQAKDWSKDKADFFTDFTVEAMRRKEQAETAKGKPLTRAEMQDITDGLTRERIFIDRGFWHRNQVKLPGEVTQDEKGRAFVPLGSFPPGKQDEIEMMFRRRGRIINQSKVERLYGAYLMKDAALIAKILEEK